MRCGFVHMDDCAYDIFFAVSFRKEAVAHRKIFFYKFERHTLEEIRTCAYQQTAHQHGVFLCSATQFLNSLVDITEIGLLSLYKVDIVFCPCAVYLAVRALIGFVAFVFLFYGRYIVVMKFFNIANYVFDNSFSFNVFSLSGQSPAGRTPCLQGIVRYTFEKG